MQGIFTKTVGIFLIISSIELLLAIPQIQAQQSTPPKAVATPSKSITIDELKARRTAIEKMKDIDAKLKADSLKYLDGAIADLNLSGESNNKTQEL